MTRNPPTPDPSADPTSANRVLLAYFSRAGENYYYGDRIDLEIGNTQVVADMIAAAISADVYRIDAADPYPHDYEETVRTQRPRRSRRTRARRSRTHCESRLRHGAAGQPGLERADPDDHATFVESFDLAARTFTRSSPTRSAA